MTFSEEDVDGWVDAVAQLRDTVGDEPQDERIATEAMANRWSEFGYLEPPTHVIRMLVAATEIGYMQALRDLRDGRLDSELEGWRPELFPG